MEIHEFPWEISTSMVKISVGSVDNPDEHSAQNGSITSKDLEHLATRCGAAVASDSLRNFKGNRWKLEIFLRNLEMTNWVNHAGES